MATINRENATGSGRTTRQAGLLDALGINYVVQTVTRLPAFFRDKTVPRATKVIAVAVLAYLVSPIDLVPEAFFSAFGLVDDLAIACWLLRFINRKLDADTESSTASTDVNETIDVNAHVVE